MYGELLYKPWELHRMLFKDVVLALDGLNAKNERDYELTKRLGLIVAACSMAGQKGVKMVEKLMPALKQPEKKIPGFTKAHKDQLLKYRLAERSKHE